MNSNYDDIFAMASKEEVKEEKKQEKTIEEKKEDLFETLKNIKNQRPIEEDKNLEPKVEIIEKQEPKQNVVVEKKEEKKNAVANKTLVSTFLDKVVEYARTSEEELDQKTKTLCVDIITTANKQVMANKYNWSNIDVNGCGLYSQIKRYAKLGLSVEQDKLYVDIRNNNKTGKMDIFIKPQYQTLEKLMVRYFTKPILRFKEDVICIGDEVLVEEDFYTGLDKIVGHKRNTQIDRNKLDNIIGAYKIAYVKEGNNIVQYVVRIDRNRIDRAYRASPSREKTVWNLDSAKMVKKTCTWEMWNDKNIRAFMIFPEEIVNDLSVLDESQEMDWAKETQHKTVEEAQENVEVNVATGEVIDVEY